MLTWRTIKVWVPWPSSTRIEQGREIGKAEVGKRSRCEDYLTIPLGRWYKYMHWLSDMAWWASSSYVPSPLADILGGSVRISVAESMTARGW